MSARGYLRLARNVDGVTQWPLGDRTVIGRSADADITIPQAEVSREHARIELRPSGFVIVDLSSRNGTFVDGDALPADGRHLRDGDEIVLAGAIGLRFVDALATPLAPRIGKLHGLWVDPEISAVWIDARRIEPPLSDRQQRLIELLHDADGEIVDRRRIVEVVWADVAAEGVSDQAVSALIKRTRARLADYETTTRHIEIVKTRGVRLADDGPTRVDP